jgi:Domain of Unknown Function with PDB structure (DUF3857)
MSRAAAAAGALVVLLSTGPVYAGLPDWAKEIAADAPEIPDGIPEWRARVLLEESHVEVAADGASWRIRERLALQYLSNRVEDVQYHLFDFDDTIKVKRSKGWHLPPGERAQRNVGGAVDITLSDDFLTDAKERAVVLANVRKGSLVFYEFEAEGKPYASGDVIPFSTDEPASVIRWSVDLPPGWALRHAWLRGAGPEPVRSGSNWAFEVRDTVPIKEEKLGPAPGNTGLRLAVGLIPPAGTSPAVPAFSDWSALGRWWGSLLEGRDTPDDAIRKAASAALASAGTAPLDRIRALAKVARDRVRYLAREVGIGGYQPHPASSVMSDLYGDCKDKGTLFRALLAAGGYSSFAIAVNATLEQTIADDVATLGSFNHFIVGVAWPPDVPPPSEIASAIVEVPSLGRLLIVDVTDEYAWPGTLPPYLAGHRAFVMTHDGGTVITLPPGNPSDDRVVQKASTTVEASGWVEVKLEIARFGAPAEAARAERAASIVDRRHDVEDDVRRAWPGANVKDYAAVTERTDGAYVETLTLEIPAGSAAIQDGALAVFAGASMGVQRVPTSRRRVDVVYETPLSLTYDATLSGLPAASAMPAGQEATGNGWRVASKFDRSGGAIHGVWTFERARTRFAPGEFPELKTMWSAALRAASPTIRLTP